MSVGQGKGLAMKMKRPSTPLPRSKAKTSPGKPGAIKESSFVVTPSELGHILAIELLSKKGPHVSTVLHALIYVAGVSRAHVAKGTGLTRGRIGHYLNLNEPVPEGRERQFYELLHDITQGYERALTEVDEVWEDLSDSSIGLVPAAVPVVREIVKACRKALADYEAAQHPKDDADEGEVA
jgi:hypothetical protein